MTLTPEQTLQYNLEACERVLRRAGRPLVGALEPLNRGDLSDASWEVLAALVWAYRKIQELEGKENNGSR